MRRLIRRHAWPRYPDAADLRYPTYAAFEREHIRVASVRARALAVAGVVLAIAAFAMAVVELSG